MKPFLMAVLVCVQAHSTSSFDGMLAPGGVWWKAKSRLVIEKPVSLSADSRWSADEIIVRAPIVTNGHFLFILARRLVFESQATIRGFDAPALDITGDGPPHASPAPAGPVSNADGAGGLPGKDGIAGNPGMGAEGAFPKEIILFAAKVEGEVLIDGTGQVGGKGGLGGRGQDGGAGAQGSKAICRAFGGNTAAGKGGNGGPGGTGGKGGLGGQGGVAVPFSYLTVSERGTGEKIPKFTCRPGAGGAGGNGGPAGQPGEGGPGGMADHVTFIFTWETEPGGPAGSGGAAADESIAMQAAIVGETGPQGPKEDDRVWQRHLGRATPDLALTFSDFEKKRFEVAIAWFEFHWWRMYERVLRGSLQMMLPADAAIAEREEKDPLSALIPSAFDRELVDTVADKWTRGFVFPLRDHLENVTGRDAVLTSKIQTVLQSAELFSQAIRNAEQRGVFAKEDIVQLGKASATVTALRKQRAHSALRQCVSYTANVLKTKAFLSRKEVLHTYFEVPACSDVAGFLKDNGAEQPIELALEFPLSVEPPIEGITPTKEVDFDLGAKAAFFWEFFQRVLFQHVFALWNPFPEAVAREASRFTVRLAPVQGVRFRPEQLTEFFPHATRSSVVGSLGLHKGYAVHSDAIDLESLGRHLLDLRKLLKEAIR